KPYRKTSYASIELPTAVRRSLEPCHRSKSKKSSLIYFLVCSTFLHTTEGTVGDTFVIHSIGVIRCLTLEFTVGNALINVIVLLLYYVLINDRFYSNL